MRSKKQCKKCKYHGGGTNNTYAVFCDYVNKTGYTCLRKGPNGTTIDVRGNNPEDCELFESGRAGNPLHKMWT